MPGPLNGTPTDTARAAVREAGPTEAKYRWVMLFGLTLAYTSFGLVSGGIPPLVGTMSEDLGLSRSAMGSVLGAWPLLYVAMSIPAGALIDRFGLRRSLAAGVLLVALSGLLRALAVDFVTLFLAVAVFGLGGPFISIGAPKLISVWFNQKERGLAMGIYMVAAPVGRILTLATANSVLMPLYGASWRLTLATFGWISLAIGGAWWVLAREVENPGAAAQGPRETFASSLRVFPALLRIRVVQIVLVLTFGSFFYGHAFNNWLPEILRDGGMSASEAGFWASVPILVGIGAVLVIPQLAKPGRRIPMLVVSFLVTGAVSVVVGTMSGVPLTLGLVLQGVFSRSAQPVVLLVLLEAPQIGAQRMGAAGGLYFTAGEVGGVIGPLLLGVVADLTGGFMAGLLMLLGLSVALAAASVQLGLAVRKQA